MTGTRFAARNRTPRRAESLKLINVTKHAERNGFPISSLDGCERGIWEAALCDHSANGVYWAHLIKGALLDPRLAPRKGF